jgi:hypothetical protein
MSKARDPEKRVIALTKQWLSMQGASDLRSLPSRWPLRLGAQEVEATAVSGGVPAMTEELPELAVVGVLLR